MPPTMTMNNSPRQLGAAQIAEHERSAGFRGIRNRIDAIVDEREDRLGLGHFEQNRCKQEACAEPDADPLPRHCPAVLADQPRQAQQSRDAGARVQLLHEFAGCPGSVTRVRQTASWWPSR
jgi:hypothetical protein